MEELKPLAVEHLYCFEFLILIKVLIGFLLHGLDDFGDFVLGLSFIQGGDEFVLFDDVELLFGLVELVVEEGRVHFEQTTR